MLHLNKLETLCSMVVSFHYDASVLLNHNKCSVTSDICSNFLAVFIVDFVNLDIMFLVDKYWRSHGSICRYH